MISEKEYKNSVKEYSRNLFRYLFKCIRNEEACNDIIQECYLKLWQHRGNINPEKIKSWLFATAHNMMINHVKKAGRTVPMDESTPVPLISGKHDNFDLKELIEKALDQLPELQKSIILLRDLEGYNYDEIGQILTLTESQVKVYLFRARQKLKEALKDVCYETEF